MKWLDTWVKRLRKAVTPARRLVPALALLAACATTPPKPTPPADATCAIVCAHGAELGCVWATPTPAGHACVEVCDSATAQGQMWRLSCLARATTCDPISCP